MSVWSLQELTALRTDLAFLMRLPRDNSPPCPLGGDPLSFQWGSICPWQLPQPCIPAQRLYYFLTNGAIKKEEESAEMGSLQDWGWTELCGQEATVRSPWETCQGRIPGLAGSPRGAWLGKGERSYGSQENPPSQHGGGEGQASMGAQCLPRECS